MTIRHSVLLITVFLSWISASASHVYNGDLSYEYVGNTTGIANQYKVNLTLYYSLSGAIIPNSFDVEVCSSCYATSILTVTLDTGLIPISSSFPCGNSGNQFYANHYSGLVTLPGLCSDFSFQVEVGLRSSAIDNLVNPGSANCKLKVILNNMQGPNSSPQFISYPEMNFCIGQNAIWANPFVENDGDSIFIKLATPMGGFDTCTTTHLAIHAGYSAVQPISTTPPSSASFIGNTPFLSFKPAALEVVTVRLEVQEFRSDTLFPMYIMIGSSTRDVTLVISQNCNPAAMQGVLFDYNAPGLYVDPASGLPTIDFWCYDSTMILPFATPVRCNSIAADGSDFRLATSGGLPLPIKNASAKCDSLKETREITLTLFNPITSNDDYYLYSKIGNDGNTLLNSCGFSMSEYDTLLLRVTNCSGIGLEEPFMQDGISIPNTFTPNGDGINDLFSITIPPAEKGAFRLQIFTRSGQIVYTNHAYTGQKWDGTFEGSPLPDGVYFVVLTQVKRDAATPNVRKQHLTLLR